MKKIERKSRVLKLQREIVVHLTHERLQEAVGGSSNTNCFGCQGSGTTRHGTDQDDQLEQKH